MSNYNINQAEPSANITINGKNRVKQSEDGKVYLDDNQEFGIELFNPTQDVLLAKIKINGNFISHAGLIIKPAERVFLDRYIDTVDKFKFSVYQVESDSENKEIIEHAIANNGMVEVYWYKEQEKKDYSIKWTTTIPSIANVYYSNNTPISATHVRTKATNFLNENNNLVLQNSAINCVSDGFVNAFSSASLSGNPECSSYSYSSSTTSSNMNGATITTSCVEEYENGKCIKNDKKTIYDTGRVEKGSKSDQKLVENNDHIFNSYSSYTNRIHIMPISVKPVTQKELSDRKLYCPNCGKKLHKKYKFCPNCGNKI